MIPVDSATYSSYEQSGLQNVEFTTAPNAQGTVLYAWIESNPSSTSTSTIYWVNLPSGIAASSTIYMNFMPSSVMSSTGPTGEAPQLSPSYGQYDDGASVFTQYGGASWSSFSFYGGTWTTANGYLQQTASTGTDTYNEPSAFITNAEYPATGQYILGMAFSYTTEAEARVGITAVGTPTTGTYSPATGYRFIGEQSSDGAGFISFLNDNTAWVVNNAYQGAVSTAYTMVITDAGGTWSGNLYSGYGDETSTPLTSLSATSYTAANKQGATSGYVGISAGYYTCSGGACSIPNPINVMWFYMRAYPPNGVMPSVSFGGVS